MKNNKNIIIGVALIGLLLLSKRSSANTGGGGNSNGGQNDGSGNVSYLGNASLPLGMRNNNPGNIEENAINWVGQIKPSTHNRFAQFELYKFGIRAMMKLLYNYMTIHNRRSVEEIILKWAPLGDNSQASVTNYINSVSQYIGVNPSDYLVIEYNTIANLTIAMAAVENGRADAVTPNQTQQVYEEFFQNEWT